MFNQASLNLEKKIAIHIYLKCALCFRFQINIFEI